MKRIYLGIALIPLLFQSINAYRITLTPDSKLGEAKELTVLVSVDGKYLNLSKKHETPLHKLKPGQSQAWNQNTIRKEFGKNAKKVKLNFMNPVCGKVSPRLFSRNCYLGSITTDLGANIKVRVTEVTGHADNKVGSIKPKYKAEVWVE